MVLFRRLRACWIESAAVVPDAQLHLFRAELEGHLDSRRVRVLHRIRDGFLTYAQQVVLDDTRDFALGALDGEAPRYGGALSARSLTFTSALEKSSLFSRAVDRKLQTERRASAKY